MSESCESKNPSELDYARLAAYIDGEGCIGIYPAIRKGWPRAYWYVRVTVSNTDPRLSGWLQETFGGKVQIQVNRAHAIHKGQKSPWSDSYHWVISCGDAVRTLEKCLPFFIIKREQAEVAVQLQRLKKRWGVKGAPTDVRFAEQRLRAQLKELKGTSSHHNRTRVEPELTQELIN